MKYFLRTAIISMLINTSCTTNSLKYINPTKLVEGYRGAAIKQQAFLAETSSWQANLDSLESEIRALPLSQASAKKQQFEQYRQAITKKAQAERTRLNEEILAEINSYIKHYGKEKGYEFILGATENGNIVYAAEDKDITEAVLVGLNKQYDQQHPPRK